MADIIRFKKNKKPKKKKGLNPFRVILAFIALILIAITLAPFLILCVMFVPFMDKKYGERLSDPIEEMNAALHDVLRMIQGEKENSQDR